jgi:hypothetical protein
LDRLLLSGLSHLIKFFLLNFHFIW